MIFISHRCTDNLVTNLILFTDIVHASVAKTQNMNKEIIQTEIQYKALCA